MTKEFDALWPCPTNDKSSTNGQIKKPDWWPKCPYPESIFPMPRERYVEIVPDPATRTALSGCLGREFWNIASDTIWEAMLEALGLAKR